ncbi:hypothetical protein J31TS6_58430 [Brevibacillus reuszeri]|nr:hypothetical protein J31TS6_58430 [Brevibacillus reuszeri]
MCPSKLRLMSSNAFLAIVPSTSLKSIITAHAYFVKEIKNYSNPADILSTGFFS